MNDFLQFVSVVASTPRLALALLTEALQTAWTPLLCAGITLVGFVAIWHSWQKRRRKAGTSEAEEALVVGIDEAAFLVWYADRMNASQIAIEENQARWLYAACLKNSEIIKAQIASEVER